MSMKESEENLTQPTLNSNIQLGEANCRANEYPKLFEDESSMFLCGKCKKTFYNVGALINHTNLQHDPYDSVPEGESHSIPTVKQNDQSFYSFKFIPLKNNDETTSTHVQENELSTCVFEEDTIYLIVKVEGDDDDIDAIASKRRRLEGVVKRTQMKPGKQPVDLRGPFTCTFPSTLQPELQCRQIFFNCCEYSLHYREEHTKRRKAALRCQVCEKRLDRDFFPSASLLPQFHTINRLTFSCRICGMTFLESTEFDKHNRNVHSKMKPYQCSICAKRFTQQGGLQTHMRMHAGIRPFVCTFCPKAFTQKAGLDQHLRTHTKVKPFKCVICSKCFSQSVHLRQHMRTHTNIQPFECSVCGRRFKQSSHLNFHMRSHSGVMTDSLVIESYAQAVDRQQHREFLNANLQPVQNGEALYYALY